MTQEVGGRHFRPPEDSQKISKEDIAKMKAGFAELDRQAGRHHGYYHDEDVLPPGAGALTGLPRRVYGDRSVEPWPGSADERAASASRAAAERKHQEQIRIALQWADIPAALRAGYDETGVWELAWKNASSLSDLDDLTEYLNAASLPARSGVAWDRQAVHEVIGLLWPQERAGGWPRAELGTYPGYLGPLRDKPGPVTQFSVTASQRAQFHCLRCGARWPAGWPDTGDGFKDIRCPDCAAPGGGSCARDTEHSIIDLHWLTDHYAPRAVESCAVCGTPRELVPRGYSGPERVLYWTCPNGDALRRDEHFLTALERAEWESTAAHHAYWLAVDMLRLAYYSGEVTHLPFGATYDTRDGSNERWVFGPNGWELWPGSVRGQDGTRP